MTTLDRKTVDVGLLEESINQSLLRDRDYAPWMADIIINLPHDSAYKKLNPRLREEIEAIIAAVE